LRFINGRGAECPLIFLARSACLRICLAHWSEAAASANTVGYFLRLGRRASQRADQNAKQFGTMGASSAAFTTVRIDGGESVIVLRFVSRSG
jgi:hypothetical protein